MYYTRTNIYIYMYIDIIYIIQQNKSLPINKLNHMILRFQLSIN